jgi:hypothetical protein
MGTVQVVKSSSFKEQENGGAKETRSIGSNYSVPARVGGPLQSQSL